MSEKNDGEVSDRELRDYFAAHALTGLLSQSNDAIITATANEAAQRGEISTVQTWAREAYEYADAMMKARTK